MIHLDIFFLLWKHIAIPPGVALVFWCWNSKTQYKQMKTIQIRFKNHEIPLNKTIEPHKTPPFSCLRSQEPNAGRRWAEKFHWSFAILRGWWRNRLWFPIAMLIYYVKLPDGIFLWRQQEFHGLPFLHFQSISWFSCLASVFMTLTCIPAFGFEQLQHPNKMTAKLSIYVKSPPRWMFVGFPGKMTQQNPKLQHMHDRMSTLTELKVEN